MTTRDLLPIPEAAFALGVSRGTIYNLLAEGKLTRVHVGRRALITVESLDRFRAQL